MRVISYGGGVQSTALLVMAAQGDLGAVDAALFANVGDDSEDPDSLSYIRDVAMPYAARHGVALHELSRHHEDGSAWTLWQHIQEREKSIPFPIRGENGAPGKRACTVDFKIKVVGQWCLDNGATVEQPADVMVGFSLDEANRVNMDKARGKSKAERCQSPSYPLLDRHMTRHDCKRVIERAGLPVPPKSSCFFCPYHKPSLWAEMRRERPALFYKAAELEQLILGRLAERGKRPMYLARFGKPLTEIPVEQPDLDYGSGPGETCDEGYCWT